MKVWMQVVMIDWCWGSGGRLGLDVCMMIILMSVFGWSGEVEAEEVGGEYEELEQDDGNAGGDDDSHGGAD